MKIIFSILAFTFCTFISSAQTTNDSLNQVKAAIIKYDSLFWIGYNDCDTTAMAKYLSPDVEFYHDKGGILSDRKSLIESIQKNLCSNIDYHLRREAVKGTVNVYPLQKSNTIYGAVITGSHVFYIWEKGKKEFLDGKARFTHLWLLHDNKWKMTRILSFDHGPAQ